MSNVILESPPGMLMAQQGGTTTNGQIIQIPQWSASTTYAAGYVVLYQHALYECTLAHTSGPSFPGTGTYWAALAGTAYAALGVDGYVGTPGQGGSQLSPSVVSGIPANGSTDGTSINVALTGLGAAGGTVRLIPGKTYGLDTSVVIPSGCTLDISGAVLTRSGSWPGPLIINASVNPQRTVTDAAITAGSSQLTSATANFTAADVGQQVQVMGAGITVSSVKAPIYATIGTVTNSTTVQLVRSSVDSTAITAATTVAGATCNIFRRDHDIALIGNAQTTITDGANAASDGTAANPIGAKRATILLRRIDRLTVDGGWARYAMTSNNISIYKIGDVTDLDFRRHTMNMPPGSTVAPDFEIQGPVTRFEIRDIAGQSTDDLVAVFTANWPQYNDVYGDVLDGYVGHVKGSSSTAHLVALFGGGYSDSGNNAKMWDVTVEHVRGKVTGSTTAVEVTGVGGGTPGSADFAGIVLRDIKGSAPQFIPLVRTGPGAPIRDLLIEDARWTGVGGTAGITQATQQPIVQLQHAGQKVTVRNLGLATDCNYVDLIQFTGGWNVRKLDIEDINIAGLVTNMKGISAVAFWSSSGEVEQVTFRSFRGYFDGGDVNSLVYMPVQWMITDLAFTNVKVQNMTALVNSVNVAGTVGGISPSIAFNDVTLGGCNYGATLNIGATVKLRGVRWDGSGTLVRNNYTGTVRVLASADNLFNGGTPLTNVGGGALSANGPVPVDLSILTGMADGDIALDSSSRTGSTGLAVFHTGGTGHGWKNLYSGATY